MSEAVLRNYLGEIEGYYKGGRRRNTPIEEHYGIC